MPQARGRVPFLEPEDERRIEADEFALEGTTAILVNPEGEVLLQHRDDIPTIRYPDYWSMPGGVLEPGETPDQTIRRELEEELGYAAPGIEPYGRMIDAYGNLIHIFLAPIGSRVENLVLGEGKELRFFAARQLTGKLTPHAREILAHVFSTGGHA